jgi:proline iminopeptidase
LMDFGSRNIFRVSRPFAFTMGEIYRTVDVPGYSEGYVKVLGYWIYFKSFGEPRKGTILSLHGGPGGSHQFCLPMSKFSQDGYRVVFYDQLGCGNSQQPQNQALYTVERYVEEVEGVRTGLGLNDLHLHGHSWGGFLNVAYAIKYSDRLRSLLVSSGSSSTPLCGSEMWRLRSEFPKDLQDTLNKYEEEGDYSNDEYLRAMDRVYRMHVCRLDPWPPFFRSMVEAKRRGSPGMVYRLMWGPNEFFPVGTIRYWDVTDQLNRIGVPTLITCGRYDEVTPKNLEVLHQGIRGSKTEIFEKSSHTPQFEQPQLYLDTYGDFLQSLG